MYLNFIQVICFTFLSLKKFLFNFLNLQIDDKFRENNDKDDYYEEDEDYALPNPAVKVKQENKSQSLSLKKRKNSNKLYLEVSLKKFCFYDQCCKFY